MMRPHLNRVGGGTVVAIFVSALVTVAAPRQARASDWGCQVVLCLATPGSPTKYAECVAPITRLWNVLATGGSFPTCTEGGVRTRTSKINSGYAVRLMQPNGATAQYTLNTRYQTISPR
jgi:hypothetical protein